IIIAYLQWRYWHIGTEKFRHIVTRDITYSDADTLCKLDVYHPEKKNNQRASPIVVFIYGGSWSSGAKYLYTPFANTLRELGYVVVVPDYRKYPKGHSAGAHLASQVVLGDAIEKANFLKAKNGPSEKRDPSTKSASYTLTDLSAPLQKDFLPQVEGLILMAGVYAVDQHLLYETSRGVEKISAMARVMGSTVEGYCSNSPLDLVKRNGELFAFNDDILDFAPRILFVHGERDTVVPKEQSIDMYNMLGDVLPPERRDEVDVRMRLYKRLGHAQCILDLMPSILPASRLRKSLIRDFQEFMDY
ncbi:Alpha/Beta hydrolase protein, partial [Radiomyces spectabilis]|uniref:Alpha/Beta hydrolase protein n=1 Tax=Radiomyces spectabilis TaxID=64574 RepID=UPI00221F55AD